MVLEWETSPNRITTLDATTGGGGTVLLELLVLEGASPHAAV